MLSSPLKTFQTPKAISSESHQSDSDSNIADELTENDPASPGDAIGSNFGEAENTEGGHEAENTEAESTEGGHEAENTYGCHEAKNTDGGHEAEKTEGAPPSNNLGWI